MESKTGTCDETQVPVLHFVYLILQGIGDGGDGGHDVAIGLIAVVIFTFIRTKCLSY